MKDVGRDEEMRLIGRRKRLVRNPPPGIVRAAVMVPYTWLHSHGVMVVDRYIYHDLS